MNPEHGDMHGWLDRLPWQGLAATWRGRSRDAVSAGHVDTVDMCRQRVDEMQFDRHVRPGQGYALSNRSGSGRVPGLMGDLLGWLP